MRLRDRIESDSGTCATVAADVTAAATLKLHGRIDIVHDTVGDAGMGGPVELKEAEWDRIVALSSNGTLLTCKHILPAMRARAA